MNLQLRMNPQLQYTKFINGSDGVSTNQRRRMVWRDQVVPPEAP